MSSYAGVTCLWCGIRRVSYGRAIGVHDFWWCATHEPDALAIIQTVRKTQWRYAAITFNVPDDAQDTGYRPWTLAHEQQLSALCYAEGEEGYVALEEEGSGGTN